MVFISFPLLASYIYLSHNISHLGNTACLTSHIPMYTYEYAHACVRVRPKVFHTHTHTHHERHEHAHYSHHGYLLLLVCGPRGIGIGVSPLGSRPHLCPRLSRGAGTKRARGSHSASCLAPGLEKTRFPHLRLRPSQGERAFLAINIQYTDWPSRVREASHLHGGYRDDP